MMAEYKLVDLFGDAITAEIPSSYTDVAQLRQVPDNQEVYIDSAGFSTLVIEILEMAHVPDTFTFPSPLPPATFGATLTEAQQRAVLYHLSDLIISDGKVEDLQAARLVSLEARRCQGLGEGRESVPCVICVAPAGEKLREQGERVALLVAMLRVEEKEIDVLVVVNVPLGPSGGEEEGLTKGVEVRDRVLASLKVLDWGLFG